MQAEVEPAGGGADVARGQLFRQLRTDVLQLSGLDREPLQELDVEADQRRLEDGPEAQAPAPDQRLHPAGRRGVAHRHGRGDLRVRGPPVGRQHLRDGELLLAQPLGFVPLPVIGPGSVGPQQRDRLRAEQAGVPLLHRRELPDDDHRLGLHDVVRRGQPVDEHGGDVAVVRHDQLGGDVGAAGDHRDEPGHLQPGECLGHHVRGARSAAQPHLQRDAQATAQVVQHPGDRDDPAVEQLLCAPCHRRFRRPDGGRHLLPGRSAVELERGDETAVQIPEVAGSRHQIRVHRRFPSCQDQERRLSSRSAVGGSSPDDSVRRTRPGGRRARRASNGQLGQPSPAASRCPTAGTG